MNSSGDRAAEGGGRWRRLAGLFSLGRRPDTTKELEHEIQELLEEGEEQGLISRHEERLITSIFDFRDTSCREIMTPAAEIVRAPEDSSPADLIDLVVREGYTRIPLYQDTPDNITGIVHAKDLLEFCVRDREGDRALRFNPPYFVLENKPIGELLRDFQSRKSHLAIVRDEFGTVRGLVTLEDIIEEIVGEIDDEHDHDGDEIKVIDENTIEVDARVDVDEVAAHFGVELPGGPYESVGGLVIHAQGRVPPKGAAVQVAGLSFRVTEGDMRRVETVRISRRGGARQVQPRRR